MSGFRTLRASSRLPFSWCTNHRLETTVPPLRHGVCRSFEVVTLRGQPTAAPHGAGRLKDVQLVAPSLQPQNASVRCLKFRPVSMRTQKDPGACQPAVVQQTFVDSN